MLIDPLASRFDVLPSSLNAEHYGADSVAPERASIQADYIIQATTPGIGIAVRQVGKAGTVNEISIAAGK